MLAFANTTNFDLHTRRAEVPYNNMAAGPSCQPAPRSPQYDEDFGRRGSFEEGEDEESDRALAKKRECARRVAAWINQSAVRITAVTCPYGASTASFDLLDLDLDLEEDEPEILGDLDFRYVSRGEPYLLYSSSSKSVGAQVIHHPTPRRPSRSRSGRRHHGHARPRMPSPLYVIQEEESE
ncbi:hypothetical protein B0H17DRAFT_1195359 [Mycena rosella]|uniref:Uncharacterized protein n=1 Tax=Mycena rosella TaxID=1033263 RepID=A0AAD7GMG4_MYCRO|nr:hypothetical protein B0H17DRAFT_1195359 [Mycena rosella]